MKYIVKNIYLYLISILSKFFMEMSMKIIRLFKISKSLIHYFPFNIIISKSVIIIYYEIYTNIYFFTLFVSKKSKI